MFTIGRAHVGLMIFALALVGAGIGASPAPGGFFDEDINPFDKNSVWRKGGRAIDPTNRNSVTRSTLRNLDVTNKNSNARAALRGLDPTNRDSAVRSAARNTDLTNQNSNVRSFTRNIDITNESSNIRSFFRNADPTNRDSVVRSTLRHADVTNRETNARAILRHVDPVTHVSDGIDTMQRRMVKYYIDNMVLRGRVFVPETIRPGDWYYEVLKAAKDAKGRPLITTDIASVKWVFGVSLPDQVGLTDYDTVYIAWPKYHPNDLSRAATLASIMAHELEHVRQFRAHGRKEFYERYAEQIVDSIFTMPSVVNDRSPRRGGYDVDRSISSPSAQRSFTTRVAHNLPLEQQAYAVEQQWLVWFTAQLRRQAPGLERIESCQRAAPVDLIGAA